MNTPNAASSMALDASAVAVRLDRRPPNYSPGDPLQAMVLIAAHQAALLRSVELSVVWYTAGKGDEDLHVHEFSRHAVEGFEPTDDVSLSHSAGLRLAIEANLPRAPLSYAGVIVKVCWCVRVRLFDTAGRQSLIETPFRLGGVTAAVLGEEPAATAGSLQQ